MVSFHTAGLPKWLQNSINKPKHAFCKRLQSIDSRGPLRCSMWPKGHMAHIGGQRPKLKSAWGAQCTELNHCLKSLNMALVTTGFSPSWLSVCCSSAKLTCAATFSKSIRDSTFFAIRALSVKKCHGGQKGLHLIAIEKQHGDVG